MGNWHLTSGTRLQELMELGGWKSFEMVLRYAHLAPEHLANAAKRIEREWPVVENNRLFGAPGGTRPPRPLVRSQGACNIGVGFPA